LIKEYTCAICGKKETWQSIGELIEPFWCNDCLLKDIERQRKEIDKKGGKNETYKNYEYKN